MVFEPGENGVFLSPARCVTTASSSSSFCLFAPELSTPLVGDNPRERQSVKRNCQILSSPLRASTPFILDKTPRRFQKIFTFHFLCLLYFFKRLRAHFARRTSVAERNFLARASVNRVGSNARIVTLKLAILN